VPWKRHLPPLHFIGLRLSASAKMHLMSFVVTLN
jgi:hypothetical protein